MITLDKQSGLFVVRADEVNASWRHYNHEERRAFNSFDHWAREFLVKPHPELGRGGHVCPFVRAGMEVYQSIYLSAYRGEQDNLEAAAQQLLHLRDWFEDTVPFGTVEAKFGGIVQLFPRLEGEAGDKFIMDLHERLKPDFVERQVMIGEFFPDCDGEGIHNSSFRPLQSPVHLFVIRHMNLQDLPFLTSCPDMMESYRARFEIKERADLDKRVAEAGLRQLPALWEASAQALLAN